LKFPAQIEELVSAFHEGLMPYTEDTINLDIELPLDQAWIIWALIDQVRFHGNEVLQPLSLEGLVKMMEFPMISLFSLAGYYRDSLDLAQMTISGIKKACTALVKRKLITTENDGYLPGKKIQTIAKGLIQICSHLRLLNKVLKEGTVYELKYWCIQSQDGLCVLWNEVDGIVQMRTLTIGKVILLIQQLVLQAVEYYQ